MDGHHYYKEGSNINFLSCITVIPTYIQDYIPPVATEISDYPLRNNRNISVTFNRTSIPQKSLVFHPLLGYETPLKMTFYYQHHQPLET